MKQKEDRENVTTFLWETCQLVPTSGLHGGLWSCMLDMRMSVTHHTFDCHLFPTSKVVLLVISYHRFIHYDSLSSTTHCNYFGMTLFPTSLFPINSNIFILFTHMCWSVFSHIWPSYMFLASLPTDKVLQTLPMQDLLVKSLISCTLTALVRKYYISSDRNQTPTQSILKRTLFAPTTRKSRQGYCWGQVEQGSRHDHYSVPICFASLLVDFILSSCQMALCHAGNMKKVILLLHIHRVANRKEKDL